VFRKVCSPWLIAFSACVLEGNIVSNTCNFKPYVSMIIYARVKG
jgi:hypothetical protein